MTAFYELIDRIMQSNASIMAEEGLDGIVPTIHNPRGGVRRKLQTVLDDKILVKKPDICMPRPIPIISSV